MTMTSTRSWIAATLTVASLAFGAASTSLAQDKPKDDGLEKLLEKLGETPQDKDKDKAPADKPKDGDGDKAKDKKPAPADQPKNEPKTEKTTPADKTKPTGGEVAPKDKEIDDLLGQLGQTKDTPSPDDKKPGGGGGSDDPMPPKSDKPQPPELKDGEKTIDDQLKGISGKKEPKKNQKKGNSDEESGPLGQVIKEMREVEERLGQPDTGEATRKKQTEIVKNLDQLIEQMKNAPSQSSAMKMIRAGQKPGDQKGQPNGDQPGAMANGAQASRPSTPKKPPIPGGLDKAIWGRLPDQLREEMGNVMNEHPLPTKLEMIRLYYLSLGTKSAKGDN